MNNSNLPLRQLLIAGLALLAFGEVDAQGCPNQDNIMLKVDYHTLDFNEKAPICVRPGETFKFKLIALGNYPLEPDDISIEPKNGGTFTIVSVNSANFMFVRVEDVTPSPDPLGFEIRVDGVGCLDPRVRIIENFAPLGRNFIDLEDQLIEEFGLSLTHLLELEETVADGTDSLSMEELLKALKTPK
jgi:hypothetical protein